MAISNGEFRIEMHRLCLLGVVCALICSLIPRALTAEECNANAPGHCADAESPSEKYRADKQTQPETRHLYGEYLFDPALYQLLDPPAEIDTPQLREDWRHMMQRVVDAHKEYVRLQRVHSPGDAPLRGLPGCAVEDPPGACYFPSMEEDLQPWAEAGISKAVFGIRSIISTLIHENFLIHSFVFPQVHLIHLNIAWSFLTNCLAKMRGN